MEQETGGDGCSIWTRVWLGVLLLAAVGILVVNFPPGRELRNGDETFYVQSGLALWEGITPSAKYAPAGPQTWISWVYAAAETGKDFIRPGPEERAAPGVLKPFVAANHALFDIYRDSSRLKTIEVLVNDLVYLAAVTAAFGLGFKRGGGAPLAGAILVGGMTAALPLFVRLSGEGRPYIMAWSFGIIALNFAAGRRARPTLSAIALGLGIGSRVDMILLFPLVFADLLQGEGTRGARLRGLVRYGLITVVTLLLIAPWSLTNLIGNLRTIATIGLARPRDGSVPLSRTLSEIFWEQGLGMSLALVVAALVLSRPKRAGIMAVYVLILAASTLKATQWGLQHQGGPVIGVITFSAVGLAAVHQRWPRFVWMIVGLTILLPLIQTARGIEQRRGNYVPDHSVAWLEKHVPAGTIVYTSPQLVNPLPTPQAADAIWDVVNHTGAWTVKVTLALKRFHADAGDLPRAYSEEDMILEKGVRRGWYILGSRVTLPIPRYDIRIFSDSPVYSIAPQDVSAEFRQTGGVLICYDNHGPMPKDLGEPTVEWVSGSGFGCRIYCSADVLAHLEDAQNVAEW